jgi:hypothetical protein
LGAAQSFQSIQDWDDQNSSIGRWGDLRPVPKREQPDIAIRLIVSIGIFHG